MSVEYQTDAVMEGEVEEPPVAPAKKKREGVKKLTDKQKGSVKEAYGEDGKTRYE